MRHGLLKHTEDQVCRIPGATRSRKCVRTSSKYHSTKSQFLSGCPCGPSSDSRNSIASSTSRVLILCGVPLVGAFALESNEGKAERLRKRVAVLHEMLRLTCNWAAERGSSCLCNTGLATPPKLCPEAAEARSGVAMGVGVVWSRVAAGKTEAKMSSMLIGRLLSQVGSGFRCKEECAHNVRNNKDASQWCVRSLPSNTEGYFSGRKCCPSSFPLRAAKIIVMGWHNTEEVEKLTGMLVWQRRG
jgi:hypothetical protein